ncbi:dead end protein homolog 1 [Erythrolamprus reginae]|uniref:dead end protein homolog 1 n=1 Tax=Erythrolamprus reginae TaxID=121349 RepID=UPI00396D03E5
MNGKLETQIPPQMWSEKINQANKAALLTWVKETGIQLVQINGQRKYGGPPPGWAGYAPPPGSEVFIGKIPQDIYEDKLIPLFQNVGRLYEFRLMMTFSGLNRGFAYAKYMNRRNAQEAIALLNNFEIQSGSPILVCRSTEKCELCIDGLAPSVKKSHLLPMLQELTPGLQSISLHASPFREKRQLAEVKYISHQAAAIAKKNLVEGSLCLCGDQIEVVWLTPIIKQELHNVSVPGNRKDLPFRSSNRSVFPQVSSRPIDCRMLPARASVMDYLKLQCELHQLGPPVIFTKCVQRNPEDWLQFSYQVMIPNYPSPFSGFLWIKPDPSGLEDHEKVKNFVALQLLKILGYPVM